MKIPSPFHLEDSCTFFDSMHHPLFLLQAFFPELQVWMRSSSYPHLKPCHPSVFSRPVTLASPNSMFEMQKLRPFLDHQVHMNFNKVLRFISCTRTFEKHCSEISSHPPFIIACILWHVPLQLDAELCTRHHLSSSLFYFQSPAQGLAHSTLNESISQLIKWGLFKCFNICKDTSLLECQKTLKFLGFSCFQLWSVIDPWLVGERCRGLWCGGAAPRKDLVGGIPGHPF